MVLLAGKSLQAFFKNKTEDLSEMGIFLWSNNFEIQWTNFRNEYSCLLEPIINDSLQKGVIEEDKGYFGVNPPESKVDRKIFSPGINVLAHVDEIEIARQLTLIEFNIFSQIVVLLSLSLLISVRMNLLQPTEYLNKAWSDADLVFQL